MHHTQYRAHTSSLTVFPWAAELDGAQFERKTFPKPTEKQCVNTEDITPVGRRPRHSLALTAAGKEPPCFPAENTHTQPPPRNISLTSVYLHATVIQIYNKRQTS